MCERVMYLWWLGLVAVTISAEVIVDSGSEAILKCPLSGNYTFPEWTGPAGLANPLTSGAKVNQTGFSFVNDTDLRISSAETRHSGNYKCKTDTGEGMVTLKVNSYNVSFTFEKVESNGHYKGTYGENLTATCVISGGYPEPEVYFLVPSSSAKGESVLLDNGNKTTTVKTTSMAQDNTVIVNASITYNISDYGNYGNLSCVANFSGASISKRKTVLVDILVPPQLVTMTTVQEAVYMSKPAVFRCSVLSVPATNISWQVGGADVSTSGYNYSVKPTCTGDREVSCESNLTIQDVKREDIKTVTCVFKYEGTTRERSQPLSAKFSPTSVTVTKETDPVDIRNGSKTVTLICSVGESRPTALVVWKRISGSKETVLTSTYPVQEYDGRYNASETSGKIDVIVDRSMHGDVIQCCGQVVGLTDVCDSTQLTVLYPPQIVQPLLDVVRVYRGDNISITCLVDANPAPKIMWKKGDPSQGEVVVVNETTTTQLTVADTSPSTSEFYTCYTWSVTSTVAQATSKRITIQILDKPSTSKPVIEKKADTDAVTISFSTSATPPRLPRNFYVMFALSNGDWVQVQTAIPDIREGENAIVRTYTLPAGSLAYNTQHRFAVKSVDSYGLVSMSETVTFTTAEYTVPSSNSYVSKDTYNKAIIIAVFVTAGVFILLIIAVLCAVRSGKCGGGSAKSYVM